MKFTTTILAAALTAVSVALPASQLPDKFTLKFTNLATGQSMGRLALDQIYGARIDPTGPASPAVIIRKGDGGGIKFPQPWTDRFPPEPMTRSLQTGALVFFSDLPNDPHAFVSTAGGGFGYNDGGLKTTWFACVDTRISQLLALYWRKRDSSCVEVAAQVVPL